MFVHCNLFYVIISLHPDSVVDQRLQFFAAR